MSEPRTGTHRRGRPASRPGAALPLIQRGRTIGVLLLLAGERQAFDEEIVSCCMHMGRNVAFALDNYEREAEREAAQEQLRTTEARLKRATRGANDGLWELDVATREMWVSPHFAELFGYGQSQFLGAQPDVLRCHSRRGCCRAARCHRAMYSRRRPHGRRSARQNPRRRVALVSHSRRLGAQRRRTADDGVRIRSATSRNGSATSWR